MQFIFFDQAGKTLFVRRDAEQATWTVETLSMVASFPYDVQKVIQQAMRVGFEDETGVLQPFEIRKVETMEPDHYQRVTCEHIAISELTDRHMQERELTNVTAQAALSGILSGTGWNVGNVAASGTSSADLSLGSVWQNVRTIESNWNVYITPRVTYNTSGITGKYLDIAPAQGTWRGIRLSLDKNADEMGVVIDDTEVKTALYGYGASTDGVPLTFASAVWSKTSAHPAKPSGQTYLEDADATADYGRNGAARFGFYQNADITDAATLLEKTWEALKATNAPRVTVNCMVRDLYRLGYADEPIRLHDTALVQIRQTHTNLQLEIIQLTVDLLDPTATRPTIGAYIPNIVYIQRSTGREASGGASNALSGRRGGGGSGGKSAKENQLSEFETEIKQNQYQIGLRAYQRDVNNLDNILKEAGVAIDADGVTIYAGNNLDNMQAAITVNADNITSEVTNRQNADATMSSRITQTADAITAEVTRASDAEGTLSSRITQTADQISLKVSKGDVSTQLAVECGNVTVSGGNLVVNGYVRADGLEAAIASIGTVRVSNLQASGNVTVSGGVTAAGLYIGGGSSATSVGNAIANFGTATESSGTISIPTTTLSGGQGTPITFNIADTKTYKDAVSAAKASMGLVANADSQQVTVTASSTKNITISATAGITYNSSTHKYTASGKAFAGSTEMDAATAFSGTEAYSAGENQGYTNGYSDGVNDGYATGQAAFSAKSYTRYGTLAYYDDSQDKYVSAGYGYWFLSSYRTMYEKTS